MQLSDLNWMDVESYLEQDDRVILIVGSIEQHGYLSLASDVRIPEALAAAAAAREQVLVAPPLNFGISPHFMEFPGTFSLSTETFHQVLYELVLSLIQHGFMSILIINGHGGNTYPPQLEALEREVEDLFIAWYEWFRTPSAAQFAAAEGLELAHANWSEAFRFTTVSDLPGGTKDPVNLDNIGTGLSYRDVLGDGSYGGPYRVEDEIMQRFFNLLVDEVVKILQEMLV